MVRDLPPPSHPQRARLRWHGRRSCDPAGQSHATDPCLVPVLLHHARTRSHREGGIRLRLTETCHTHRTCLRYNIAMLRWHQVSARAHNEVLQLSSQISHFSE